MPVCKACTRAAVGSGSLEQDGSLSIVTMEEEEQARLMHDPRLGKGEGHAHKTGEALAQRVIPALDMGHFSGLAGPPPCAAPVG